MTGASPGGRFVWIRLQLAVPDPAQPVQLVDVRDVGVLVRRLIDDDQPGTFQAVGQSLTIGAVLVECARGLASTRARFA